MNIEELVTSYLKNGYGIIDAESKVCQDIILLDIKQDEYCFDLSIINQNANLLINSKEQIFVEKIKSLLKLGFRSTRYKDLFDFYYLINKTELDKEKLMNCFNILIFKDETMRENNIEDVVNRLQMTFDSNAYRNHLSNPKNNWLDITVDDAIISVLKYIKSIGE